MLHPLQGRKIVMADSRKVKVFSNWARDVRIALGVEVMTTSHRINIVRVVIYKKCW